MFRMTYNQANIKGGILMTCSCNFVFGMQEVSTKEFQRNLAIRSLNAGVRKERGRGFQTREKWTGNQSTLSVWVREALADAVARD